jgi:hypothetical protein
LAHVPKTIDNDLPLPGGTPTFGFKAARSGHGSGWWTASRAQAFRDRHGYLAQG